MADLTKIADERVAARLAETLPRWTFDAGKLRRTYETADWRSGLALVAAIGWLAEAAWHHPELTISFNRVATTLWTHDVGGVTERDLALAARIEALVVWEPDASGPFETPPRPSVVGDDRRVTKR